MADEVSGPSLADEQRELTRSRIRNAAMEVVARRGFDATVEEIARVSGVSRRTIFRHYESQSALILTTVQDMFAAVGRRPIEGLPRSGDDLDGWLEGIARTIHTRNAEILGRAFWDIHTPNLDETGELAEVAVLRRDSRRAGVRRLTRLAWQAAGGEGEVPADLELAFALNLSAFATQALMIDFNQTPEQIGALTAHILRVLLHHTVNDRRVPGDDHAAGAESGDG